MPCFFFDVSVKNSLNSDSEIEITRVRFKDGNNLGVYADELNEELIRTMGREKESCMVHGKIKSKMIPGNIYMTKRLRWIHDSSPEIRNNEIDFSNEISHLSFGEIESLHLITK